MLRKIFWLTSQLEPYRIHIRLQVRVACLGGFLDLCQSVKNKFFDRLTGMHLHSGIFMEWELLGFLDKKPVGKIRIFSEIVVEFTAHM